MTIRLVATVVEMGSEYIATVHADTLNEALDELREMQNWKSWKRTMKHFDYSEKEIKEAKKTGFYTT